MCVGCWKKDHTCLAVMSGGVVSRVVSEAGGLVVRGWGGSRAQGVGRWGGQLGEAGCSAAVWTLGNKWRTREGVQPSAARLECSLFFISPTSLQHPSRCKAFTPLRARAPSCEVEVTHLGRTVGTTGTKGERGNAPAFTGSGGGSGPELRALPAQRTDADTPLGCRKPPLQRASGHREVH